MVLIVFFGGGGINNQMIPGIRKHEEDVRTIFV
jgi:hypothetical protein